MSDKAFFEKGIYYIGVFKRNDERTIYNVLYRDGKNLSLIHISSTTGSISTPASRASVKAPALKRCISPSFERVPSDVYKRQP